LPSHSKYGRNQDASPVNLSNPDPFILEGKTSRKLQSEKLYLPLRSN